MTGLLVTLSLLLGGLILLCQTGGRQLVGVTADTAQTHVGDAVVVAAVSQPQLRPGGIVAYRTNGTVHVGQLANYDLRTGLLTINQPGKTALQIYDRDVVGRACLVLPHLGSLLERLRQQPLWLMLLYLPAANLIWREITRLKPESSAYRLYGHGHEVYNR